MSNSPKRFVIIDGNAILHRAFHAYPLLTNSKGEVINAVFGFFTMFLNVIHDQNPEYVAVCFDRSKPTMRQNMYAGYHAHRPQMSDDLAGQIGLVDSLLSRMGVPIFTLDGYEGDDMLGTLSVQAVKKDPDVEVIIVSGDRDMFQLVNPRVKVLMLVTGITKYALFDEAAVEAKYGVHPRQFIDYKALIGDPSDGYPGVTGIGPKTASTLLQTYQTFENLYEHIGDLPEKTGSKLAMDAEQAALAKKLARIICDAPITLQLEASRKDAWDIELLREGFVEQGFGSLVGKLDQRFGRQEKKKQEKQKNKNQLELL